MSEPFEMRHVGPDGFGVEPIRVYFQHDMEDSWYRAEFPDGRILEGTRWWPMLDAMMDQYLVWESAEWYRPDPFPAPGQVVTKSLLPEEYDPKKYTRPGHWVRK